MVENHAATPSPDKKRQSDPSSPLIQILPRRLIIVIFVVALLLLLIIFLTGSYWPSRFQHSAAKFFVCAFLAFCFAIVMFVIYPQNVRVHKIPFVNLPVEVVGPPALFIAVLPLLWHLYPNQHDGFYELLNRGKSKSIPIGIFQIESIQGGCECYPVIDPKDHFFLTGIYAKFNDAPCTLKVRIEQQVGSIILDPATRTHVVDVELK